MTTQKTEHQCNAFKQADKTWHKN